ncbi:MAG: ABC transporter permease subunit [Granulosicoccus sp.]
MTIDSQAGVTRVSPSLVKMRRVFGCSKWRIIFWIVIPAALHEIITGVRLAVVRAIKRNCGPDCHCTDRLWRAV